MSVESLEVALRKLTTENTILRDKLSRYEDMYGTLPNVPEQHGLVSPQALASPGVPFHSRAGSQLTLSQIDFSQDGNASKLCRFPNPYVSFFDATSSPSSLSANSTAAFACGDDDDDVPTFPLRPSFREAGPAARRNAQSTDPHVSTEIVHFGGHMVNDPFRASNCPLYLSSTFIQPSSSEFGAYDYSRSGNPTRTMLETLSAKLEGAHASFAFASGMAALQAVVAATVKSGEAIVASSDLYGGMHRDLMFMKQQYGIEVLFVDTTDLDAVEKALTTSPAPVRLVHIESPSNPLCRVTDLRRVAQLVRQHTNGARVSVDATMMTPLRMQPLALGCDYAVHSATKFFGGHSDVVAGVVSCADEELSKCIAYVQNAQGTALEPFSCFLLLRGIKTMAIRLERCEVNAVSIAQFLAAQTHFVKKLYFAGLEPTPAKRRAASEEMSMPKKRPTGDDGDDRRTLLKQAAFQHQGSESDVLSISPESFALHWAQATGPGTVISFETGDIKRSKRFVDACRLFKLTVSFGATSSSIEMPCAMSHASIKKEMRTLPEDLVRLSIGIEHVFDLISDLVNAIQIAMR